MSSTSSQPSPSASKNAQPAPIASGSHFFPDRPALCEKWIPATAVTSVNRTGSVAGAARCGGDDRSHRGSAHRGALMRENFRAVVVNRLPFIIVLGAQQTGLFCKRLRSLVRFEAAEQLLLAPGVFRL